MNRKLYVGNISYETTETDLETLFSQISLRSVLAEHPFDYAAAAE